MVTLDFEKSADGLIPAIAQDHQSGTVLMLAYINKKAWQKTVETGTAHYWSRSRQKIWQKGESSGNTQRIKEILVDCDRDCVVFRVEQVGGAACHRGFPSCFYRQLDGDELVEVEKRVFDPEEIYGSKP